jgi:hypothetical protein
LSADFDLALDLADFESGHSADITPDLELGVATVRAFVVARARLELVLDTIEGAEAVEVLQSRVCAPQ